MPSLGHSFRGHRPFGRGGIQEHRQESQHPNRSGESLAHPRQDGRPRPALAVPMSDVRDREGGWLASDVVLPVRVRQRRRRHGRVRRDAVCVESSGAQPRL
jgi:hypothetical protein